MSISDVLLICAGLVWIIGGNVVVSISYERRGLSRPWFATIGLLRDLNGKEWATMAALLASSIALAALAAWLDSPP